ncbi:glycosyl transferase family 1 [Pelobium manganitolerans]|uniref:Glycosyl transferase family 1 n=1 Tax=Pelobium manganitolerans TaxID=1842495 RepID=A0A419SBC4_9SPHI|nr:glycosyltransferase [Pelobium manganitolerans]RKD20122.1 glycosyl transferase family 1 [Pelobium manganitolerans]
MRVIHLNTYDGNGGAGRAAYRLNTALKRTGVKSDLFTYIKMGKRPDIEALYPGLLPKFFATLRILAERYLPRFYEKDLKVPFSLSFFGKDIHKHPALQQADIIHLHWINHGFLNPQDIAKLALLNKPIVWTLHDSNTFTGGCHVRFDCQHYLNSCGLCPLLKDPEPDDISHQTWERKNKAYAKLQATFISPSNWLGSAAKNSGLLKHKAVFTIPNTLETDVFKPQDKQQAKLALGLSPGDFVLLSGFMPSKKDAHKGTSYLVNAIDLWLQKRPDLVSKVTLIVFGNKKNQLPPPFKIPVKFLGTIHQDEVLAQAYAAADAFLTTSLDDNLPNTVMESLACGTPVISFTTGGIPDMVKHQENGYLAKYKDATDFMQGLEWIFTHPNKPQLNQNARDTVVQNFSEEVVAQKHMQLYQKLIKENGAI